MKNLCRVLGALLTAAFLCVGTVRATSFSTDQSDIWNAVNEPGWAAEFVHRGSAIFAVPPGATEGGFVGETLFG